MTNELLYKYFGGSKFGRPILLSFGGNRYHYVDKYVSKIKETLNVDVAFSQTARDFLKDISVIHKSVKVNLKL